jgi:hypothetical protein
VCETSSLTLRDEHTLRVIENRVLRIFAPEGDEVKGDWRELQYEELHDLYSSPTIMRIIKSKRNRCVRHIASMGRRGKRMGYWESLSEQYHLKDQDVGG